MTTLRILKIMNFLVWFIFIGLCITTGTILTSFIIGLVIGPTVIFKASPELSLIYTLLLKFNIWHYVLFLSLATLITGLKAYLFYFIIKITSKVNLIQPFSLSITTYILRTSYVAISIGILTIVANSYGNWFAKKIIDSSVPNNYFDGGVEFIFLAGIIFVIAQVFKRGVEIQNENELTI